MKQYMFICIFGCGIVFSPIGYGGQEKEQNNSMHTHGAENPEYNAVYHRGTYCVGVGIGMLAEHLRIIVTQQLDRHSHFPIISYVLANFLSYYLTDRIARVGKKHICLHFAEKLARKHPDKHLQQAIENGYDLGCLISALAHIAQGDTLDGTIGVFIRIKNDRLYAAQ